MPVWDGLGPNNPYGPTNGYGPLQQRYYQAQGGERPLERVVVAEGRNRCSRSMERLATMGSQMWAKAKSRYTWRTSYAKIAETTVVNSNDRKNARQRKSGYVYIRSKTSTNADAICSLL